MGKPEQQKAILEGMAEGKSLRAICRGKRMPAISTVLRWCADDKDWRDQYARAREAGDDAMADDIQDIADEDADPQDKRVRIDARKWLLAKRQPKKYGDKIDVTSGGERVDRMDDTAVAVRVASMIHTALSRESVDPD